MDCRKTENFDFHSCNSFDKQDLMTGISSFIDLSAIAPGNVAKNEAKNRYYYPRYR